MRRLLAGLIMVAVAVAGYMFFVDSADAVEEVRDLGSLSQGIRAAVDQLKVQRGYYVFERGEGETETLILLGAGAQNCVDCKVNVKSAKVRDGVLILIVEEKQGAAADAVNYPFVLTKVDSEFTSIQVKTTQGLSLSQMSFGIGIDPTATVNCGGEYVGQVDNNFHEIVVDGTPTSFMLVEELHDYFNPQSPLFKNFQEHDQVAFSYYVTEHGTKVITCLVRK